MNPTSPDLPPQPGSNTPYDPTNRNDPRYDPARDPRYNPRWQREQQQYARNAQRAAQNQDRAARRAQAAAWKAQSRAQRDQWKLYLRSQRRTSIVGPLLLIAVGTAFYLIHSGRVELLSFFGWYARWWPVLLIVIGLLRLGEWAFDRARQPAGASPLRYSVGGGVIFAVVALSCLGLILHAGGRWHADSNGIGFLMRNWSGGDRMGTFFGDKHEEDTPQIVHAMAQNAALSIDNPNGSVTVTGTSDDGKLHLSVHKEVFTNSDSTAAQRLSGLAPVLEGSESSLTLRVPAMDGGNADLTLLVPATTRVVLNSNHGDVHASNLKLPLSVTANNGDVEIAAVSSSVQAHVNNRHRDLNIRSVTGDVQVDGDGDEITVTDITGPVTIRGDFVGGGTLQRVNGPVEYHSSRSDISLARLGGELEIDGHDLSASEAVGPVMVKTRSRNITLDRVVGDITVTNSHGDVDVRMAPPTGTLTVDNQNGNVNVSLPGQAKFTLSAETSDGDAHSDFSFADSHTGRGTLSGSMNGGGAAVRLNTSHGDINISRNSSTPLPPAPARPPRVTASDPTAGFQMMDPSQMQQLQQIQRDAMETAANAMRESAKQMSSSQTAGREEMRQQVQAAREQVQAAREQAREAMREAKEKQKEAEQMAREAERNSHQ